MHERRERVPRLRWLLMVGAAVLLVAPAVAQADEPLAPAAVLSADPGVVTVPEGSVLGPAPPTPDAVAARVDLSPSVYAQAKADADSGAALRPAPAAPVGPLAPPTFKTFNCEGVNQTTAGGLRPPDVDGAVGNSHIVEVTNSHIDMYTKPTTACAAPVKSVTAASFFGYTAQTLFDPRVIYDETWDRWVITFEAFAESSTVQRIFIGVSTSANPLGAFCVYNIDINTANDTNFFYDYPQLGQDQDAVLFSANIFSSTDTFRFAHVFAVAKARLYNCLGFSVPLFLPSRITIQPPVVLDQNPNSYFITARPPGVVSATNLGKYTATNTANAFAMTFVGPTLITVPSYSIPPSADQPGTTDNLDTLEARFVNRSTQIGDSLFQVHTIATGTFATPKWYEIDTEGAGANTIKQSGFFFENSLSDDWNASIAANASKEVFVTWNSTQGTGTGAHNARIRFSGRQPADAAGVIPAGTSLFTSATFYNPSAGTVERWGDYSYVDTDPSTFGVCAANRRAWAFGEKINAVAVWGRRFGRFGFC